MGVEHWSNDTDEGKRRYSGGKPIPLPLWSSQTPHGLTCHRTWCSVVNNEAWWAVVSWSWHGPKC